MSHGNPRFFFTQEMLEELEDTFQELDVEKTGVITSKQLRLACKAFGVGESKELLAKVMADVEEFIDLDGFLSVFMSLMQHPQWAYNEMKEAFTIFDKDMNGYLDPVEMKRVFTKLGEQITDNEVEDQLREHDIDGDCHLVMAEFMKMVLSHQRNAR